MKGSTTVEPFILPKSLCPFGRFFDMLKLTKMNHKIIIIPGLGNNVALTSWAVGNWKNYDLEPVVYSMNWHHPTETFQTKLNKLTNLVDQFKHKSCAVSLIGCSAGASAALNAFLERKSSVNKAISLCGRLKTGSQTGSRSLKTRSKSSPTFADSVSFFENREDMLTKEDKKRIMTVRSTLDELVPADTATLTNVTNITIPVIEHSLSIYLALKIFNRPLIDFLKS